VVNKYIYHGVPQLKLLGVTQRNINDLIKKLSVKLRVLCGYKFLGIMLKYFVLVFVLFAGCVSSDSQSAGISWLDEYGSEIVNYGYTKAQIEKEVEERWREYGYTSKPDKYIALSFDDGPCGPFDSGGTTAMLAALEELKIKATFFVIGQNVRSWKPVTKAIIDAGHELGNHSNDHSNLGSAGIKEVTSNLDAASLAIKEITGSYPLFFRAPYLNHGASLSQVCKERGMPLIDGSAHNDWDGTGHTPASITASVLRSAQDGGIIILHDNNTSKGNTMKALPAIAAGLREKGFWILTIGQLAAVKEITLKPGQRYNTIN
jgi:peptidoglycan/xylan/chitin deacetylase (PgdA/CDA1 family)